MTNSEAMQKLCKAWLEVLEYHVPVSSPKVKDADLAFGGRLYLDICATDTPKDWVRIKDKLLSELKKKNVSLVRFSDPQSFYCWGEKHINPLGGQSATLCNGAGIAGAVVHDPDAHAGLCYWFYIPTGSIPVAA